MHGRVLWKLITLLVACGLAAVYAMPMLNEEPTRIGVHYFTWYRANGGTWGNGATEVTPGSPKPLIGWYDSGDTRTIDAQIDGMEAAGFDFAIVHLIADSAPSWENADRFVMRLRGRRLQFAVMLDGLNQAPAQAKAYAVAKAMGRFFDHPGYVRRHGSPLLMLFSAKLDFDVPDGVTVRNVYWTPDYREGENGFNGGPLYPHDWPFWMPTPQQAINGLVPIVPGYSDTHLKRPLAMEHPRRDGRMYHEQWQRALALRPELITVYSWNEYFEQTMIEPTDAWGDRYVRWTACYATLARAGKTGTC